MNFDNGVTFDLSVKTSDNMTAASLASLLKAGVLYRKINATPVEKLALESMTVDNQHDLLQMHFKTDDQRFQSLLKSDLFASVSHRTLTLLMAPARSGRVCAVTIIGLPCHISPNAILRRLVCLVV